MEVKIENMVFGWHEELPEMFIELLNTLVLTKNEQDVRGVMEVFARKELFNVLFAFGYGAHHLWVTQKKASDPDQCLENRLLIDKAMTTRMTINGVSTCTAGEKYEKFQLKIGRKVRTMYQYDYRHTDGDLFSCVKPTLDECRRLRDEWIKAKEDRV